MQRVHTLSLAGQRHIADGVDPDAGGCGIKTKREQFFTQDGGQQIAQAVGGDVVFRIGVAFLKRHTFHNTVRILHVIRIIRDRIVAEVTVSGPDAFHQLRLSAVGGGVIALGQLPLVEAANAVSFLHGFLRVAVSGNISPEDLIVGGVYNVVVSGCAALAQHIGAGGHGLGLQRLQREGIAHFIGHNAQQVILHMQSQNGLQHTLRNFQPQVALIQSRIVHPTETDLGRVRVGVPGQGQVVSAVQGQIAAIDKNAVLL